jgi:PIN domain nuclease of toxin-antitoxin system
VILLDTHILIWLANEPAKLSKKATDVIRLASQEGGLGISAITLWELARLATHGRLALTGTVEAFVERIASRTSIHPVTAKVAVLANQWPETYSHDPCDRLIGATALALGCALVTKDRNILACKQLKTIW